MGSVRPVHLIRVAEGPPPGQGIHDLQEAVSEPGAQARESCPLPHTSTKPTLGILQGFGDSVPWKEGASWLGSSSSLWHDALSLP